MRMAEPKIVPTPNSDPGFMVAARDENSSGADDLANKQTNKKVARCQKPPRENTGNQDKEFEYPMARKVAPATSGVSLQTDERISRELTKYSSQRMASARKQ